MKNFSNNFGLNTLIWDWSKIQRHYICLWDKLHTVLIQRVLHNWAHTCYKTKVKVMTDAVQYMTWMSVRQYIVLQGKPVNSITFFWVISINLYTQRKARRWKRRKTAVTRMWRTSWREQLEALCSIFTKTLPPQGTHIEEEGNSLFLLMGMARLLEKHMEWEYC